MELVAHWMGEPAPAPELDHRFLGGLEKTRQQMKDLKAEARDINRVLGCCKETAWVLQPAMDQRLELVNGLCRHSLNMQHWQLKEMQDMRAQARRLRALAMELDPTGDFAARLFPFG